MVAKVDEFSVPILGITPNGELALGQIVVGKLVIRIKPDVASLKVGIGKRLSSNVAEPNGCNKEWGEKRSKLHACYKPNSSGT